MTHTEPSLMLSRLVNPYISLLTTKITFYITRHRDVTPMSTSMGTACFYATVLSLITVSAMTTFLLSPL